MISATAELKRLPLVSRGSVAKPLIGSETEFKQDLLFAFSPLDREAPVVECPMNIVRGSDTGKNFATVTWSMLNVTDNSGEVISPTLSHDSGSEFAFGNHTVSVNATDSHGNTGGCSFSIEVRGNLPDQPY